MFEGESVARLIFGNVPKGGKVTLHYTIVCQRIFLDRTVNEVNALNKTIRARRFAHFSCLLFFVFTPSCVGFPSHFHILKKLCVFLFDSVEAERLQKVSLRSTRRGGPRARTITDCSLYIIDKFPRIRRKIPSRKTRDSRYDKNTATQNRRETRSYDVAVEARGRGRLFFLRFVPFGQKKLRCKLLYPAVLIK